jgi:hypothetical protein
MVGLRNYIRDKPPDRSWLNPATFLNQQRFLDAPAPVTPRKGPARNEPKRSGYLGLIEELYDGDTNEPREHAHGAAIIDHDAHEPAPRWPTGSDG